ncbi:hypothetical protein CTAYLR_008666 [Chrysophaeum taylorii]|uniref:Uncharacterized protein n=1 Tax=Chrysophaeum taylorii TaxID=2483200 RepID=A0AAD7U5U4_9STRA|nr:hypothetical protein CTAYLR_008666 [Chrysophaeum taylorii]
MGFVRTLELRTTLDNQDAVNVVAFSPARRASWSVLGHESSTCEVRREVGTLLRWNAKLQLPWSVWYRVVACVVETEPREPLYASGSGPSIQMWRGATRVSTLRGHVSIVRALSFAPEDGGLLASASYDNTIKLWRETDARWRCSATLTGHVREVLAVSIQPDRRRRLPDANGRLLASGSWDGTVRVWSISRAERRETALVQCLRGGGGAMRSVAFAPDGAALATGCDDSNVRIHAFPDDDDDARDSSSSDPLKNDSDDDRTEVLRGHELWVYCVAFSSSRSDVLASCSQDLSVRLWFKVREDEFLGAIWTAGPAIRCHLGWVYSVAFSADGEFLASGAADRVIKVFRLDNIDDQRDDRPCLRHVHTLEDHDGIVYSVAFPPRRRADDRAAGVLLASGSVDGTLALWRIRYGANAGVSSDDDRRDEEEEEEKETDAQSAQSPS